MFVEEHPEETVPFHFTDGSGLAFSAQFGIFPEVACQVGNEENKSTDRTICPKGRLHDVGEAAHGDGIADLTGQELVGVRVARMPLAPPFKQYGI
jgi:hypothetical protein